jgi:imidazolonepropionase-like amidohydrolase
MKKNFALLCLLLLLSSPVSPQAPSTKQRALALTHVTVIDATGTPAQPDVTIVIRGDRIVVMGKSGKIRVPAGSQVVNAAGKFLIPGLWDMHFHWYHKESLPLTIANGVTGVRVMLGYAEHHEWRKEIETGQLLGPHMVIASRTVDGPKALYPWSIAVANETEARQAVINAQEYGADFVKVVDDLPRDAFFALADETKKRGIPFAGHVPVAVSAEEASNAGERSIEHLTRILDASSSREADLLKSWQEEALAGGPAADLPISAIAEGRGYRARMQLALETYDPKKAEALFALLRANHTWQCPTLTDLRHDVFFEDPSFARDPRLKYVSLGARSGWQETNDFRSKTRSPEDTEVLKRAYQKDLEVVGAMRRAGVEFLAGTDAANPYILPGFSLHDELGLLVQAGLTPMEALQAATLNPARFLGREHDFGTVAPGKIADLVLLDANPLEDIGNTRQIAAVVYGGKLFPRASLHAMLAKIEGLASRKSIGDLLEATIKERGVEAGIRQYRELKSTQPDSYDFGDTYELSDLGHQLLHAKKFNDAIQIFELNAEAFPRWWWAYDDLGEAYMDAAEKKLAIKNYKRSLQLDPAQTYATAKLKQLNSQ